MRLNRSDEYLALAEKYDRLARETRPDLQRQQLENMAKEWRRLAAMPKESRET
jgi:hypothetical protein